MYKKKIFLILLFLILAISVIAEVSASDINETSEIINKDCQTDEVISQDSSEDIISSNESGENPLNDAKLILSQSGSSENDKKINIDLVDSNNIGIKNTTISLVFSNSKGEIAKELSLITDDYGKSNMQISLDPEIYTVTANIANSSITAKLTNFKISKTVSMKTNKLTTLYNSDKKFRIKVVDSNEKTVSGVKLNVKIYTGKKYKTLTIKTDSNGIAEVKINNLKAGKHKVIITTKDSFYPSKSVSSTIKIKPRPVAIQVISIKDKKLSGIAAYVKDKNSKKFINGVSVKYIIYSGKKHKTIKLVTGQDKKDKMDGGTIYMTNLLKAGKHKVKFVISGNYKGKSTGKLVILKSAKKGYPTYGYFSKGKLNIYSKIKGIWFKIE